MRDVRFLEDQAAGERVYKRSSVRHAACNYHRNVIVSLGPGEYVSSFDAPVGCPYSDSVSSVA